MNFCNGASEANFAKLKLGHEGLLVLLRNCVEQHTFLVKPPIDVVGQHTLALETLAARIDAFRVLEVAHGAHEVTRERALIETRIAGEVKTIESA